MTIHYKTAELGIMREAGAINDDPGHPANDPARRQHAGTGRIAADILRQHEATPAF
jgi:hypothetical protein